MKVRTFLRRCAVAMAGAYAALCLVGCVVVNRAMFHPPADFDFSRVDTVWVGEGVSGVWSPVPNARKTVLYSHGNAEDVSRCASRIRMFNALGYSVLVYDYPGYGLSTGTPTERGVYDAADSAYAFLTEKQGLVPSDILVVGYSIGSGPACYLAEKYPVGSLVLLAPFKSAIRVVTGIRLLPYDPFPNLARIRNVKCPIFIYHGTADRVVPFSHGKALAEARPDAFFFPIPDANHFRLESLLGPALWLEPPSDSKQAR